MGPGEGRRHAELGLVGGCAPPNLNRGWRRGPGRPLPQGQGAAQGPHPPSELTLGHLQEGSNQACFCSRWALSSTCHRAGPPVGAPACPSSSRGERMGRRQYAVEAGPGSCSQGLPHAASCQAHSRRSTNVWGAESEHGAVTPAVSLARTYVRVAARQPTGRVRVWAQEWA